MISLIFKKEIHTKMDYVILVSENRPCAVPTYSKDLDF